MKQHWMIGALVVALGWPLPGLPGSGWFEVMTQQAELHRVSSGWEPSSNLEGRWWWEPSGGGSAWVRLGDFQFGPLVPTPTIEGRRAWGPGTRVGSGYWGLDYESALGGFWLVQTPSEFQAGLQWTGRFDALHGASNLHRRWFLNPVTSKTRWTDEVRVGFRWTMADWTWGSEVEGAFSDGTAPALHPQTKIGWESGPWEMEGTATAHYGDSSEWKARGRLAWQEDGFNLAGTWWSSGEATAQGQLEPRFGRWQAGPRWSLTWDKEWTGRGGLGASGSFGLGRWKVLWEVVHGDWPPEQHWSASWKEKAFEVSATGTTRGRVGWLAPGSELKLTWRQLF